MGVDSKKLEEWRSLCEGATPGPWEQCAERHHRLVPDDNGLIVVVPAEGVRYEIADCTAPTQPNAADNAAFIAASRTAVPELLAALEELRGLLGSIRPVLDVTMQMVGAMSEDEPMVTAQWKSVRALLADPRWPK